MITCFARVSKPRAEPHIEQGEDESDQRRASSRGGDGEFAGNRCRLVEVGYCAGGVGNPDAAQQAAVVSSRGAQVLAKAVENSQETDAYGLSNIGWSLGGLARLIPPARQMNSQRSPMCCCEWFQARRSEVKNLERQKLADLYVLLEAQDLVQVLRWPFSVSEAEKIALAELEQKTGPKFGGDIWKFVEQAPSLGIKDLDAPAKRPKVKDALTELKVIPTGNKVPRTSGRE